MPLFVSEINFAAVTLTENVGVIFCSQNRIRRITLVKYTKIICISTFAFLQAKTSHPYAPARRFLRSLRFSIERGANIVFLPINPMILVI